MGSRRHPRWTSSSRRRWTGSSSWSWSCPWGGSCARYIQNTHINTLRDFYLLVAMGFLISRAREKGFVTATLSAASTGSTSFHFDDLVRDKLVADFFFFKAVLNKHLDVSWTGFVRICRSLFHHIVGHSASMNVFISHGLSLRSSHNSVHLDGGQRWDWDGCWLRLFEREIVAGSVFNVHSAQLLELFWVLVHAYLVQLFVRWEKDALWLFHGGVLLLTVLGISLWLL